MDKIYIYGASGHGKVVLDIVSNSDIEIGGFIDDNILLNRFEGYAVIRLLPQKSKNI